MARNLNSKQTNNGSSRSESRDVSNSTQSGNSTSSEEATTTKTDQQNGESVKTGESRQFANIACQVSFSIPILGRVPIDSNSPC